MNDNAKLFTDGQAYERVMGRWSQLVATQFLDWLGLPNGLSWVDVGCGNGAFTEILIDRCAPASVTAVDPSEGQLEYARTRPGTKSAQFRVGDAQALPFGNAEFEAAAMALVISFVPDPAKAAAEMARVVRPGGWAATYMWDVEGGGLPTSPMYRAMKLLGLPYVTPPGSVNSRMEAMQGFWQRAGLRGIETRVIRIPVTFANFDDYWESNILLVGPLGQALARLPAAERERLKNHLRETLPAAPDRTITHEAFANAVKGQVPG
ncbi:MAG: methyltransferase domain-containing protein [Alphaproteobacteria bacterium]|nr:methyltransferase domain-containing protein [Alphaproteobacteria bacterium]